MDKFRNFTSISL